ncbi:MAG: DUF1571 domain-containing protein [Planctomycetota bacterium]|nr:DUF1571 domain-containing protein [Planctomycetota bacterium]
MSIHNWPRFIAAVVGLTLATGASSTFGQAAKRPQLDEPVYRVTSKLPVADQISVKNTADPVVSHPLDPAIEMAHKAKIAIDQNVRDYTCTLVKRERVSGKLFDPEYMHAKIRQAQHENGELKEPFSVYLKFLKPANVRNRQVIYVEGENQGNMIAKESGLTGRLVGKVELPPTGMMAMRNNRYPITEIGIRTLVERLIEKGERDRKIGPCEVRFLSGSKVGDRTCTCLEVIHPKCQAPYDFHKARIFIDDEYSMPIRYEAYSWPERADQEPELLEEYTYLNIKFNVGLTDADFDAANPSYGF